MSESSTKTAASASLHALLFLEAIFLANPCLKEKPVRLVFGFDYDAGFFRAAFDLRIGRSQYGKQ